jgi:hypothetical protein
MTLKRPSWPRWSRLAEVLAVGIIVAVCLPLYLGWRPEWSQARDALTPERVETAIVLLGSLWWVALCFLLPLKTSGRAYVKDDAGKVMTEVETQMRTDSLVIAGLVLAALTLGPATTAGAVSTPLTAALPAFLAAWAVGFGPGRVSAVLVRDTLHWIGLSCLLAATYGLAVEIGHGSLGPEAAVVGASLVVALYSYWAARAHWRAGRLGAAPTPARGPAARPQDRPC